MHYFLQRGKGFNCLTWTERDIPERSSGQVAIFFGNQWSHRFELHVSILTCVDTQCRHPMYSTHNEEV